MAYTILIVDDEFGFADLIAELLRDAGHDVELAINGKLALASLATRRVDLVLTDLMMPVMDGAQLIRCMKADPALAAVPTVLMTAVPEAIVRSGAGAHDALLVKPFGFAELTAILRALLPGA